MSAGTQLDLLKVDLGFLECAAPQEVYLRGLLTAADAFLTRRGVALTDGNVEDDILTASVAAWMYRARGTADRAQLPRNLDIQIKDRICARKMGGGET